MRTGKFSHQTKILKKAKVTFIVSSNLISMYDKYNYTLNGCSSFINKYKNQLHESIVGT